MLYDVVCDLVSLYAIVLLLFFFNDTATTEIYTLSLHDALPISYNWAMAVPELVTIVRAACADMCLRAKALPCRITIISNKDRKSTRLNSSHANISYAVFCLKKKKKTAIRKTHKTIRGKSNVEAT